MTKIHRLKLILIVVVLLIGGCAAPVAPTPSPTPTPTPTPALEPTHTSVPTSSEVQEIKNVIQTNVQDTTVQYLRESFWSENDFAAIVENKGEFTSRLVDEFINTVSGSGKEVSNPEIIFNSQRRSITLNCEITGAISKTGNRYYATFEWLIRPLGLDFIDDDFGETEDGLFWEGFVNGIATTITVELPTTDGFVYKAWEHPIGHCHAHVWWELAP